MIAAPLAAVEAIGETGKGSNWHVFPSRVGVKLNCIRSLAPTKLATDITRTSQNQSVSAFIRDHLQPTFSCVRSLSRVRPRDVLCGGLFPNYFLSPILNCVHGPEIMSVSAGFCHAYSGCAARNSAALKFPPH